MEFTAWEDSQHRHSQPDFVDHWDNPRPFEQDPLAEYDELDPHDTGPSHAKALADDFGDGGDHGFFFDDPSIHVPAGMSHADFVGPGDLHGDARAPLAFGDGEPAARGHKRELSEAFTMRYPLVSPSHAASYGHHVGPAAGAAAPGDGSLDLTASMMRTPVRGFSAYPFDGLHMHDSPSYAAGAGLESPLESLALQSPYMSCQPFPALPRVQEHQGLQDRRARLDADADADSLAASPRHKERTLHPSPKQEPADHAASSGSPPLGADAVRPASRATRKMVDKFSPMRGSHSSSGSLSSNLSAVSVPPQGDHHAPASATTAAAAAATAPATTTTAAETTPDRGPQTPRTSTSKAKSAKPRRTPTSATPKAAASGQTATSTPTPAQDGRRDSRKRIAKDQIEILEAFFHKNPRPEREDRMRLSSETNLEPRTVQIWFQNRRAKSRSMKMPPSHADNSVFAQQYRAAAAAASNAAAAAAGSQPMVALGPQGPFPMDKNAQGADGWAMAANQQRMMASPAGSRHGSGYGVFQPQQRVYTGHGSPPPHNQAMGRYHQQLGAGKPVYGPGQQSMQGMQGGPPAMQFPAMQQMHPMHQGMIPNQGPGPQLMPAMPQMRMGHGRSASAYEPFVSGGYGLGPADSDADGIVDASMMYASKAGSTASLTSATSSFGHPQSPLNTELVLEGPPPVYSPSMQSLQNSPDLNSPATSFPVFVGAGRGQSFSEEPAQLSRSQSAHSFSDPWTRAAPMSEMKRRRSLYGAVPTWGWADGQAGPYVHASPPRTPSLSSASSSAGSTGGTLAASAAAAALRTRNRSSTQPAPRSRQPSIRLQLDESNHSATLVVLPQETESPRSGGADSRGERPPRISSQGSSEYLGGAREMSPDRAERAAKRLLAERAAAATMSSRPSTCPADR